MRIGVFGGTFNPIHYGHLLLAETARETLTLDRVLFIPTASPPHKRARDLLPGPVRLELITRAIKDQPAFVASEIELQRGGTSYAVDTVRTLRQQLPQATLFLLIGEDMLAVRWLAWEEITRLCTVVVAHRPPHLSSAQRAEFAPRRSAGPAKRRGRQVGGVRWLAMPQVAIASSDIRARVRAGRSIRYLVPPAVERYIREHHLYGKEGGP